MELVGMMRVVEVITNEMYAMKNVEVFVVKEIGWVRRLRVCVVQWTSTHMRTTCRLFGV